MVQFFFHDFIKSSVKPIEHIIDYFYRVEFHQKGSPHIHCSIWIKGAVQYQVNSDTEIVEVIDKYVTCSNDSAKHGDLINFQLHKHAKTSKKRGHNICRFNFPIPPMPRTMILQPIDQTSLLENCVS